MTDAWEGILGRYGQQVTVDNGGEREALRAFLQPVREEREQLAPSPLGLRREERWLYLGPARRELFPRRSVVLWKERAFEVVSARTVGDGHHVWAILREREGTA